jgi:hypothetical protein
MFVKHCFSNKFFYFFRELVPKSYFERYQHNGQHVVNKPTGKVSLYHKLMPFLYEFRSVKEHIL